MAAPDPLKYFRVEAREILDELGKGMLVLEKGPPLPDLVGKVLRLAHTLKGAARVVKQREIADLAHTLEDAIAPFRDGGTTVSGERIDGALKLLDLMSSRVAALAPPANATPEARRGSDEPTRTLRANVDEVSPLLNGLSEINVQLAAVRRGLASLERVRHMADLLVDQLTSQRAPESHSGATAKTRRLATDLQSLVAAVEREAIVGLDQTERELGQVREGAERLRLLPAGLMFTTLERAVRDVAVSLGKQVTFETKGGEVRLDANLLGAVQSALVQAVRNAVAHGIESTAQRKASGKPSQGRIVVEVSRRGSRVSFACSDDGRGVNLEAVRLALQRRGALPAKTGTFGADELLELLLKGGTTTSETITELSGRGIGLDVVRETAARLGGEAKLRTEAHLGTTLEIVVPASVSSLEALVVEADGQAAAIPLDAVRCTMRLGPKQIARSAEGDSIVLDGKVIPFVSLTRRARSAAATQAPSKACSAVVVESGGMLAAVGVDRLVCTQSIVLRPLPDLTPADSMVAGASLDPEGNPQMVLDPDGLAATARRSRPAQAVATSRAPILVIDDSMTTRMLEQSILESAGYEVDLATSGEEALDAARQRRHALFLVDVEMPGIDGFTFIERTRADPLLRDTPAILVTSRSSPEDRIRGEAVGASAYVVKSEFDQTDLLERIQKLVG